MPTAILSIFFETPLTVVCPGADGAADAEGKLCITFGQQARLRDHAAGCLRLCIQANLVVKQFAQADRLLGATLETTAQNGNGLGRCAGDAERQRNSSD